MKTDLIDLWTVARHDWQDALRSRRIVVWFILYLTGSIAACLIFAEVIQGIETEIAKAMGLAGSAKPGALINAIWEKESFMSFMNDFVGDSSLLKKLMSTPPFALFYGGLSFMFTPLLVIILSSDCVATDVANGYVRFNIVRTSRMSWIFGKMLAHAMLLLAALGFSAVGALIIGSLKLAHFDMMTSLPFFLEFMVKSWLYSLPYLGIAMAVSQWTRSPNLAKVMGLLILFAMSMLAGLANFRMEAGWTQLWEMVLMLLPQGHRMDFWLPDISKNLMAGAYVLGLTVLYTMAGFAVFHRRDL